MRAQRNRRQGAGWRERTIMGRLLGANLIALQARGIFVNARNDMTIRHISVITVSNDVTIRDIELYDD